MLVTNLGEELLFGKLKLISKRSAGAIVLLSILTPLPAQPAAAQFGGLFKPKTKKADSSKNANSDCATKPENKIGRSIFGKIIRDATNKATRNLGVFGNYVPRSEVSGILTDSIACKLDQDEQLQAADVTEQVTQTETVGSTVRWSSETRQNVSGSSTVTERTEVAGGTTCMNVTDIIIVEGEETKVSKRMCKMPGQSRYTIA
jgi:surface antigen